MNSKSNFYFPVPGILESGRVQLTPFSTSAHANLFIEQSLLYPQIFDYLPFGPFKDTNDFIDSFIATRIDPDPGYILFAVWDKTKSNGAEGNGAFAGLIGLINTSKVNLSTEIGCVMILPPFQRTHVTSNAVGLLLKYALNLPAVQPGALGLRRVVWQANVMNAASIRTAERMQFRREGTLRWDRLLPEHKSHLGAGNGKKVRDGDPRSACVGRDTALLGLCWDDWEDGARDKVEAIIGRLR
ncbi:hypothetical protein D9613_009224 [Agrocybe pediades]|uniref:N-acetyltransferase domain-containing protein n=1 Tax=Agrocybe pediades TaxID=84607 RepID=A0A8H4VTS9_9AGAR|nr:hypothetical protein D9613_009224 [Agrocybe pediades]